MGADSGSITSASRKTASASSRRFWRSMTAPSWKSTAEVLGIGLAGLAQGGLGLGVALGAAIEVGHLSQHLDVAVRLLGQALDDGEGGGLVALGAQDRGLEAREVGLVGELGPGRARRGERRVEVLRQEEGLGAVPEQGRVGLAARRRRAARRPAPRR